MSVIARAGTEEYELKNVETIEDVVEKMRATSLEGLDGESHWFEAVRRANRKPALVQLRHIVAFEERTG